MAIGLSGQISLADIGFAVDRSWGSTVGIYEARNGIYAAINNNSSYRPTANGQSGYAFSHWYGYDKDAVRPRIFLRQSEAYNDTNSRLQLRDVYGNNYYDNWYFWCTPGGHDGSGCDTSFLNWGAYTGQTIRSIDYFNVYFYKFDYTYNPYWPMWRSIVSDQRGTLADWNGDASLNSRFYESNFRSGELIYCYNYEQ
jgi:hypothetical protein